MTNKLADMAYDTTNLLKLAGWDVRWTYDSKFSSMCRCDAPVRRNAKTGTEFYVWAEIYFAGERVPYASVWTQAKTIRGGSPLAHHTFDPAGKHLFGDDVCIAKIMAVYDGFANDR